MALQHALRTWPFGQPFYHTFWARQQQDCAPCLTSMVFSDAMAAKKFCACCRCRLRQTSTSSARTRASTKLPSCSCAAWKLPPIRKLPQPTSASVSHTNLISSHPQISMGADPASSEEAAAAAPINLAARPAEISPACTNLERVRLRRVGCDEGGLICSVNCRLAAFPAAGRGSSKLRRGRAQPCGERRSRGGCAAGGGRALQLPAASARKHRAAPHQREHRPHRAGLVPSQCPSIDTLHRLLMITS